MKKKKSNQMALNALLKFVPWVVRINPFIAMNSPFSGSWGTNLCEHARVAERAPKCSKVPSNPSLPTQLRRVCWK